MRFSSANIGSRVLSSPTLRFFTATLIGTAASMALIAALLVGLGGLHALSVLSSCLPITLLMAVLAAGTWSIVGYQSTLTQWILGLLLPTGLSFEACTLLAFLSRGLEAGSHSRYDSFFILANVILALSISLITVSASAWLKHKASR